MLHKTVRIRSTKGSLGIVWVAKLNGLQGSEAAGLRDPEEGTTRKAIALWMGKGRSRRVLESMPLMFLHN